MSDLAFSNLLADHAVLQRGKPIHLFGKVEAGSEVEVHFRNHQRTVRANAKGEWSAVFPSARAGGPYLIKAQSGRQSVSLGDIWIGDVWVCSGQSNMEWKVADSLNAVNESKHAKFPTIRYFRVTHKDSAIPLNDVDGKWEVCSPKTVGSFSGVGFAFAREVQAATGVPIGLLDCSWGGSEIEPYVPIEVFKENPKFRELFRKQKKAASHRHLLATHYQGMVHALTQLPVKGILWYQGESNTEYAAHYVELFPTMIEAWREAWKDRNLPFYFVQLANFAPPEDPRVNVVWPELREAQTRALRVKKTGMAVAIDVGDKTDIHPRNKWEVGRRLALLALSKTYGRKRVCEGPVYHQLKRKGAALEVEFNQAGRSLKTVDGKSPRGFQIAGDDNVFHAAEAVLELRNKVRVSSEKVKRPVSVCYAWTGDPEVNLVNSSNLPAVPFRTDSWKWVTQGKSWPD